MKPPARPSGQSTATLHIAISQRTVAKHLHMPGIIEATRDEIADLAERAERKVESGTGWRMQTQLERATGLTIAQLVEHTKRWPI